MFDGILGGDDRDEPDIIVQRAGDNWWEAVGPKARSEDAGRTQGDVFESIAYGRRRPSIVVEVRTGSSTYRTTVGDLRKDYSKDYRGPNTNRVDDGEERDPFYDFV